MTFEHIALILLATVQLIFKFVMHEANKIIMQIRGLSINLKRRDG